MKEQQTAADNTSFDQITRMVENLDFSKKMELLRRVYGQRQYREEFYRYTERLARKNGIKSMTMEELDEFLHAKQ